MTRIVIGVGLALCLAAGCSSGSSGGGVTTLSAHHTNAAPTPAGAVTLSLSSTPQLGHFLVSDGRTLYMYPPDRQRAVTCTNVGECEAAWPPLFVGAGSSVLPGPGVRKALVGTIAGDGGRVVTYNKWPLYYYIGDHKPGEVNGQDQGFNWFVIAPNGVSNHKQVPVDE
jgi:predicted lipoprotein with Yx(FWY)xxD motif